MPSDVHITTFPPPPPRPHHPLVRDLDDHAGPADPGAPDAPARTWSVRAERWLLFGLFSIGCAFVVYLARPVLIPLTAALFVWILFTPVARRLRRLGLPAPVAAALCMIGVTVVLTASVLALRESLGEWINHAPETLERLQVKLAAIKEPVETIQEASENLEEVASMGETGYVQQVEIRPPSVAGALLSQSMGVLAGLAVCLALSFLLLCSGEQIVANTVSVASTFAQRRRVLRAIRHLERDMSRYLALRTAVNALLGIAAYILFALVGLPNPLLWAATMALLNYVPYFGAAVVTVLVAIISIVEFDSLAMAMVPPAALVFLNIVEGFIITPIVLGRCLHLHAVMIFLATVIGGWIWGIAGALLAVPILASLVIVFRHFPPLQPIARFLGGDRLQPQPTPVPASG